jgi:hypothetical protein
MASIDRPDINITPGSIISTDIETICVSGYSSSVRNVSGKLKKAVYDSYNVLKSDRGGSTSKMDHLIPLMIGGSNNINNLWPHYFNTDSGYGVLKKNDLENTLHRLVCKGKIDIKYSQLCISANWINCYNKHVNK